MRILISTAGSHGDVLPFIALAREFNARGHDVILYANPFFERYAAQAGISFVPVGSIEAYHILFNEQAQHDPRKAFAQAAKHIADVCPDYYWAMKADVIPGQTIVIGNSLLFAARLLQETDNVPCATVHLAPSVFQSDLRPARLTPIWINETSPALLKRLAWWSLDRFFYAPHFAAPLNRFRAELDLPPVERIFSGWIHGADIVLGLFPGWFAAPQADWPAVTLTGFPLYDHGEAVALSPALEAFLGAGPAPVVFSAGTATATAADFFKTSMHACRLAGVRAVFLSHFAHQIPASLPDNILAVEYAPFSALLPRAAAFVHHGGIGTTSQALRAGVPQLIRPVAFDQFDNAQRAVRLGVAKELLPNQYTARAAAAALTDLVGNVPLKQACRNVALNFVQAAPIATACDAILARCMTNGTSQGQSRQA